MKTTDRLHYFDILKGMAIFLVVMGHVLTMCIREIDRALLFKIIGQVHMPLFFFISGYFTYKASSTPRLSRRFSQLIIPGIVVGLIWMLYFPHSGLQSPLVMTFEGMWCTPFKNGYWFTITLFEIIAVFAAITFAVRRSDSFRSMLLTALCVWILLITVQMTFSHLMIFRLMSLELVAAYFPAFMTGVLARRSNGRFTESCLDPKIYTVALVASGLLLYIQMYPWEFSRLHPLIFTVTAPALHIALAIVSIALVKPWSERALAPDGAAGERRVAMIWEYIGKNSLAVYLLHYFFLFPMPWLREPLREMALDIVPAFTVAFIAASLIVSMTLLANYIISRSPILARLLTGKS